LFAYRRTFLLPASPPLFPYILGEFFVETLRPYHPASTVPLFYVHLLTYCFFIEYTLTHLSFCPTCRILSRAVRIPNIFPLTIIMSMVSLPTQRVQHEHTLANGISSTQTRFFLYITHSEHPQNTSITVPPTYIRIHVYSSYTISKINTTIF
jgi:hypothetical protein